MDWPQAVNKKINSKTSSTTGNGDKIGPAGIVVTSTDVLNDTIR